MDARPLLSLCWAVLILGCATTRAAYVPMPLAGGPMPGRGRAQLALRVSGMPDLDRNDTSADESLHVPALEIDASISVRASRYYGIRLGAGISPAEVATPASGSAISPPTDPVGHAGFGIAGTIPLDEGETTTLSLTFDQAFVAMPIVRCMNDGMGSACVETRATMPMLALEGGVYASTMPMRELRITGGLALRNQPLYGAPFGGGEGSLGFGDAVVVLLLRAEVHVTEWLSFVPEVQWAPGPLPFLPAPTLGLGVALTLPGSPGRDPWIPDEPGITRPWGARDLGAPYR